MKKKMVNNNNKDKKYELLRLTTIKKFAIYRAAIILAVLIFITNSVVPPLFNININSDPTPDLEKVEGGSTSELQKLALIPFFKNLPKIIGKFVIGIFIVIILKSILDAYSIDLSDPIYTKWVCLFNIILFTYQFLTYVIEFIIYKYISKHKDIIISKNLPIKLYERLVTYKEFADFKPFIKEHFYLYFYIYGFLTLMSTFFYIYISNFL